MARLAGLEPAATIVEILNEDGSMARRPDLEVFARKHKVKIGTIADLIRYRLEKEQFIDRIAEQQVTTAHGEFTLYCYEDAGVVIVLREQESSRELMDAVNDLARQEDELQNRRTGDAVLRTYGVGAQILRDLGVHRMRVLSAPKQMQAISGFDLEVTEYVEK